MTEETYVKASELRRSQELLKEARRIISYPYPELTLRYAHEDFMVDFVDLDEKTRDKLKDAIRCVIDVREEEIYDEFKNL